MNGVVLERVPVPELPQAWRDKLDCARADARVTARIEKEPTDTPAEEFVTDAPAFGIWRDREDMAVF
ncbi:MAG: hypothetical protein LBE21_07045 [Pseudomonadales bacterium]|jgi:hypothetical protein|nr:hypothetical protein [Pseudomonadales bacterium]